MTRGQRDAANLYLAWSIRLARLVELVGAAAYEFWLLTEWDHDLALYCERPLVEGEHPSTTGAPDFWIKPKGNLPYYVCLVADESLVRFSDGILSPKFHVDGDPSCLNGTKRDWVSDRILHERIVGIRNRKFLNPFATQAARRPDLGRRDAIKRLIKVRGCSLWRDVERAFEKSSVYPIRCEIAYLLHKGTLHADLDANLLCSDTQLSASP